jgi:hypothetical protein
VVGVNGTLRNLGSWLEKIKGKVDWVLVLVDEGLKSSELEELIIWKDQFCNGEKARAQPALNSHAIIKSWFLRSGTLPSPFSQALLCPYALPRLKVPRYQR